jgi:hypothetical protein
MFKPFYVNKAGAALGESWMAIAVVNRHFYVVESGPTGRVGYYGKLVKYSEDEFHKNFKFDRFISQSSLSIPFMVEDKATKERFYVYSIEDGRFYLAGSDSTMISIDGDSLCSRFIFVNFACRL